MKIRILYISAVALLCCVSLSGCDLYERYVTPFFGKKAPQGEMMVAVDRVALQTEPEVPSHAGLKSVDGADNDEDKKLTDSAALSIAPKVAEHQISVSGEWVIETVEDKKAIGQFVPYLRFEPSEMRVYGNNGCNTVNAQYLCAPTDSILQFSNIATTMMMCHQTGITDVEVSLALENSYRYVIDKRDESLSELTLYNMAGREVMTLVQRDYQFLNGTWQIVEVDDMTIDNPEIKIVIDTEEGKIHGFTGCNTFNGTMETLRERPNSLSFQAFAKTRKGCGEGSVETPLLVAFEEADTARPMESGEVALYDILGKRVIVLRREN